jgi:hypothetical protein
MTISAKPALSRDDAAKRLYGGGPQGGVGHAVNSYYERYDSKLRGKSDTGGLIESRQERAALEKFARDRGMSNADLHVALSVMNERDLYPLSQQTVAAKRAGTKEQLRIDHGGEEQRDAHLQKYVAFTTALAHEVPTLAARANANGAGEDRRLIDIGAKYGAIPNTTPKV